MKELGKDKIILADPSFREVLESVGRGEAKIRLSGLRGSAKALLAAILYRSFQRTILVVTSTMSEAGGLFRDAALFLRPGEVFLFPPWDLLASDIFTSQRDAEVKRAEVLSNWVLKKPALVVVPLGALLQRMLPGDAVRDYIQTISIGDVLEREAFLKKLDQGGYRRTAVVEEKGEYSVRGHVLDIFSPLEPSPRRLLFFGDEVESIKIFDCDSQRSSGEVVDFVLSPARELILSPEGQKEALKNLKNRANDIDLSRVMRDRVIDMMENGLAQSLDPRFLPLFGPSMQHLLDHAPGDGIILLDDAMALEREEAKIVRDLELFLSRAKGEGKFHLEAEAYRLSGEEMIRHLEPFQSIQFEDLEIARGGGEDPSRTIRFLMEIPSGLREERDRFRKDDGPLKAVMEKMKGWFEAGHLVALLCSGEGTLQKMVHLMENYALPAAQGNGDFLSRLIRHDGRGRIVLREGKISTGFHFPLLKWVVISEEDIFGKKTRTRRARPAREGYFLKSFGELKEEDFVVHADHGIGIYRGLHKLTVGDIENDFLLLEYSEGDKLYIPVDRLDQIQRYIGPDGHPPKVDKLGGTAWETVKKRVKRSVEEIAGELVSLYAARESMERRPFSPPDTYYDEFSSSFEYEETPDQNRAIEDVNFDMAEARPMDRLICGDAGFGKTEVAIRAAFRAVMEGKQAAVLVPTTILAEQHYHTFSRRLEKYPVRVEVLNRFKTKSEQKKIAEDIQKGAVDIAIGTHRLLQKDVAFKDLGLVVIDEEQRFGVSHKEKLKHLRTLVDVLTLTATPIPRTLQLSLVGIRDLSVINTPPQDRRSIRTHVLEFEEEAIQKAIREELERDGQVFFVHDRIQSIYRMAGYLEKLVPEARIVVAHGRMKGRELEEVMVKFVRQDYNVLVCTTIIGSGIDIPTANTIIINRADRFGLSQLYQLRGRVGRSKEEAAAYLLIPQGALLSPDALKRLQVIRELTDPGSGFHIASHDLEIRGSGNILGVSQSGHVAAVGYEMYIDLMESTIREMRGERPEQEEKVRPEIHLGLPAFIPEDYISDMNRRLVTYKRISMASTDEDLEELREELVDCYGFVPLQADNLLDVIRIRNLAMQVMAKRIDYDGKNLTVSFFRGSSLNPEKIVGMVRSKTRGIRFTPDFKLHLPAPELGHAEVIRAAKGLLGELMN
jgi:transcription-repair coupling factor (superfamily II helicase)